MRTTASNSKGLATAGRSEWPRKTDPVLDNLLRDFRSAKLRRDFFNHDVKEYTETLDVKVLVSSVLPYAAYFAEQAATVATIQHDAMALHLSGTCLRHSCSIYIPATEAGLGSYQ